MEQPQEPEIVRACRALYAAIDRLDHTAAERLGVSRNELRCLNLLEHGPCRPGDIARQLDLTTGSITTMLDRLERKGLVIRSRNDADRRGVMISPTPQLFQQLGPIYRAVATALVENMSRYSQDEQALAVKHLDDVTRACEGALQG